MQNMITSISKNSWNNIFKLCKFFISTNLKWKVSSKKLCRKVLVIPFHWKYPYKFFVVEESKILKKCTKPFHFLTDRATTEKQQGVLF